MELKDQVTSLEIAKQLYNLGVTEKSLWRYDEPKDYRLRYAPFGLISAYTSSELMDMLPSKVTAENRNINRLEIQKDDMDYVVYYYDIRGETETKLADALGKMFIYLIENNLVEVKK